MSLYDYIGTGHDFFRAEPQPVGELDFPCCCCEFRHRSDSTPPCSLCVHNVNAKEATNANQE